MADNDHNTRWPSPSVTSVPEYQLSGLPCCETKVGGGDSSFTEFKRVSRWIVVHAVTADANIFFKSELDDDNNQYFIVKAGTTTPRLEVRCTKVYFNQAPGAGNKVSIIAGLTHIDSSKTVPETMLDWIP
jgi:hypothetical protein